MTWSNLIQSIIVAIVTALIAHYLSKRRENANDIRGRRCLALQIAFTLEQFAVSCASSIQDNANHRSSNGTIGKAAHKLPELFDYPANGDYSKFDPQLLGQLLAFRLKIESGNGSIDFNGDLEGEIGAQDECVDQCARLGLQAIELSNTLINRYDLPAFELEKNIWDFKEVLRDYYERWKTPAEDLSDRAPDLVSDE